MNNERQSAKVAVLTSSTLKSELHAEVDRFDVALAVLAGLSDEQLVVADDDADEALVAEHVATLRVSVRQAAVGKLAKAAVLTLCGDRNKNKRGRV